MRGFVRSLLAAGISGALVVPAAAKDAYLRCIDTSDGTNRLGRLRRGMDRA